MNIELPPLVWRTVRVSLRIQLDKLEKKSERLPSEQNDQRAENLTLAIRTIETTLARESR